MKGRLIFGAVLMMAAVLLAVSCAPKEEATPTKAPPAPTATTAPAPVGAPTVAPTPTATRAAPTPTATPVPPPPAGPKRGGTIKGVNESGAFSLDNLFTSQFSTRNVAAHMYETIVTLDDTLAVKPQIVDWDVKDGKNYTFTIRQGLTWHNGKPVTADDLIASIERWKTTVSPGTFSGIFVAETEILAKVNDRQFVWNFKRPLASVLLGLSAMAGRVPVMMPKEIASATPANKSVEDYSASGPYKLKNWVKGDRVELARYAGYVARTEPTSGFAGKREAYADEIWIMEVPDPTTRLAGLQTGQFDYVAEIANDLYKRVKDDKNLNIFINVPGVRPFVWFNHRNPPTDNKDIRRAIVTAFDNESALKAAGGGAGSEFYMVCGLQTWCVDGVDPVAGPIKYTELKVGTGYNANNKTLARELALKAGYKGELIELNASQDVPTLFNTSQVFNENLKDAGFNVKMNVRDHAANDALIQNQTTGWNMGVVTNAWANSLTTRFRSAPTSSFASGFQAPDRMKELATLVHFESDKAKLIQYLNEIDQIAQDYTGCCYFVGEVRTIGGTRTWLKGFKPHPVMFLVNSWLDK